MKYRYDLHNLGREIGDTVRDSVKNAVRPEDVQQLKGSIDDIVRELSQIGQEFTEPRGYRSAPPPRVRVSSVRTQREKLPRHEKAIVYDSKSPAPKVFKSIDGIVLTILGFVFAGISTVLGIVFAAFSTSSQLFITSSTVQTTAQTAAFVLGWLFSSGAVVSALMLTKGTSLRKRAKRCNEYLKLFAGCKLYSTEQLAIVVDRSRKCVVRDLQYLISCGKLPCAHLDVDKTSIILDEETYSQYLVAEQKSRELSKHKGKSPAAVPEPQPQAVPVAPQEEASPVDAVVAEGRAYIGRINAANVIIQDDVVSQKIEVLEEIVCKIFDCVSEHPEKQGDLRKLMSYYLPTTLKLLDAYSKFEAHAIRGENVSTAMREIEGALDTINLAFKNLLDDLFEHEMYDITSDISALETMLAQEGLTAHDFADDNNNAAGGLT